MTDYKDVGKAALGPRREDVQPTYRHEPLGSANWQAKRAGGFEEDIARLEAELAPMTGRLEELKAEQQSLHDDKADIHECQREVLMELYDTMHPVLVSHGLIPELDEPVDADWHEAEDDTQTPAVEPAEHSTDACGPKAASPSSEETATSVKSTSVKLQTDAASNPTTSPSSQSQEPMKRDYQIAKAMFRGAEEDFEFRFEKLQHNRYIIEQQKAAAGEVISDKSLLQLDMQDITETRRLAKALAEAEENLAKAKEACLLAGVDTADSEMESGFLDGVDDGYSVSEEKEMIASVTPAGMERWLKQISDNLKIEQDGEEQSREHGADADVRSVEIEDSASMVAQGASRRRIDKWREMYQTLAVTE
ncbi:hypothetical protein M409DRAFT_50903 [Zasmidium cellare ATCC 36951]|uniref:Uncharacterized protein n=1 Tax=Zasmidium cellare ATCC 36951 TaxID=1080233 RepID=A0A6A6CW93_ZASCE|nr:uncharacterized protein M409DRAFT_50903 [Zasmidium cellare ATCC 36951]KAF2171467.1 hypothetical protein M409DRAFT_50903 [Zasmidium cellare ATCC 36951]